MKRSMMCIAVLLLACTVNAAVEKGDKSIDLLGGYVGMSGDVADVTAMFATGRYGYFITPEIELAGAAIGAWIDADLGDDITLYGVGVSGKYHFMTDKQWVPYVGGQFLYGVADMGSSANGTIYGPLAGIRCEMTKTTDFFVEGWYMFISGDLGDAVDSMYAVLFGFSHSWE